MTTAKIRSVETFIVALPRDVPYLGPLGEGEQVNERGYFVRRGNRTIYPTADRSALVKITASDGTIGWGETYGIVAPRAVTEIVADVFAPLLAGRVPVDIPAIWDELYSLMRVRGHWSGFFTDALAAVDLALWDLAGKIAGRSVADLLGGVRRTSIPAYASGLPRATLDERVELAQELVAQGFRGIKFAAVVSQDGAQRSVVDEMRRLREAVGNDVEIMVDLHWKYTPTEAITLIRALEPFRPYFVEAPCAPEDVDGQADVAANVTTPIAGGEEWSTVFQARTRFAHRCVRVVQPEVAHTGLSQFAAIGKLATAQGIGVVPHATIGVGIFHAASLLGASTLADVLFHEHQHSVFDANLRFIETEMRCVGGAFELPRGPGLGAEPKAELWNHLVES
ncbi:MAG: mandelate racemase/muconate lactonizing enzyme family protein [Pseudomonadota bacterium]|nr:mandelate racemase/muconate lactonizing enzyme family protein [Pseudomonadota bacterium]